MEKEKKKWETPKLICLYRGRPDETVLVQCKNTETRGPGSGGNPPCNATSSCQNQSGS